MSHSTSKFATGAFAVGAAILFAGTALADPSVSASGKTAAKPAVAPAGTVLIGNFKGPIVHGKKHSTLLPNHGQEFGWGWAAGTDRRMGGHSTVKIALAHPGANGTPNALKITGDLKSGFPFPWSGAFWFPGRKPMQSGDLSASKELVFWAKGTPGHYKIMLRTGSSPIPQSKSFGITPKWKEYHISLEKGFPGANWKRVMFIGFSAAQPGKFSFELDQVSLQ